MFNKTLQLYRLKWRSEKQHPVKKDKDVSCADSSKLFWTLFSTYHERWAAKLRVLNLFSPVYPLPAS